MITGAALDQTGAERAAGLTDGRHVFQGQDIVGFPDYGPDTVPQNCGQSILPCGRKGISLL